MSLELPRLDPLDGRPQYQQIAAILRTAIRSGVLAPGSALPTVRRLTAHFGVATGTVATALRLLVDEGTVQTRPGLGTYVPRPAGPTDQRQQGARR